MTLARFHWVWSMWMEAITVLVFVTITVLDAVSSMGTVALADSFFCSQAVRYYSTT